MLLIGGGGGGEEEILIKAKMQAIPNELFFTSEGLV